MSNEFKSVQVDVLNRAIEMLRIAGEHSMKYGYDFTVFYDGADCDGCCINTDCQNAISDLQSPSPDGEVVFWLVQSIDQQGNTYKDFSPEKPSDGLVDWMSRQGFTETKVTPLYTAPPRVVDEALAEKVCILYYNEPAWKFMSHKKECIGNMQAALKAALEKQ